ncbi:MAG: hypothetical protein Q4D57_03945 [Clostridia bacterium]|nr:hypothetical protein [Clostridia bacterium]
MKLFKKILSSVLSFGMIFNFAFSLPVFAEGGESTSVISSSYIPKTLEECYVELDKKLSQELKDQLKTYSEYDLWRYHMGLGLWIRNNWLYPCMNSRIYRLFEDNGCDFADDISAIIIKNYRNYLLTGESATNIFELVIDHEFKNLSRFDKDLKRETIESKVRDRVVRIRAERTRKPRTAVLACTLL